MSDKIPAKDRHDTIKEVVNTFPAAPGMYVEKRRDNESVYLLVVAWAEIIDADGHTRVVGLTLMDIAKPHTDWPLHTEFTSQPDRNSGTIVR